MAFTTISLSAAELSSLSGGEGRLPLPELTDSRRTLPEICEHLQDVMETLFLQERPEQTQPGTLVQEAYSRLRQQRISGSAHDAQFIWVAAQTMRQLLRIHSGTTHSVEGDRNEALPLPISEALDVYQREEFDVLKIDEALIELEKLDANQAKIVELRFFGGLAVEEIARALNVPVTAVRREWSTAKLWLQHYLSGN
ncbi:MAG: ECF-type sigma factor [Verrucomicrobiota bacterium]